MDNINSGSKLNTMIGELARSGAAFDKKFHLVAYNCLHLVNANGDFRPLQKLYLALTPANQRALKAWAVHFGRVNFDNKLSTFKYAKTKGHDDAGAQENSPLAWEKARKQPAPRAAFDFKAELDKLIEKARKAEFSGPALETVCKARALV
jgi:hypothetical protein